jgi:hypothetical protein
MNLTQLAIIIQATLAIASSCGLRDGIQAGKRAINDGEINIHARFDKLGADDTYRLFVLKGLFYVGNDVGAMRATHQPGQMDRVCGHDAVNLMAIATGIDDAEDAVMLLKLPGK